jgi:hypothetical protein
MNYIHGMPCVKLISDKKEVQKRKNKEESKAPEKVYEIDKFKHDKEKDVYVCPKEKYLYFYKNQNEVS